MFELAENDRNYIPIVTNDFKYVEGNVENGFVISDQYGNEFVWIPVNLLTPNGTLDGINFNEQFGKRYFGCKLIGNRYFGKNFIKFTDEDLKKDLTPALKKQIKSIKKYGGFYVSRYMISCIEKKPKSVINADIWVNVTLSEAIKAAVKMSKNWDNQVSAHLLYGPEYDSIIQRVLDSEEKSYFDVCHNSSSWGNYLNHDKHFPFQQELKLDKTGRNYNVLNINGLSGNAHCLTMENHKYYNSDRIILRNGSYLNGGGDYPASCRIAHDPNIKAKYIGFRLALYIK